MLNRRKSVIQGYIAVYLITLIGYKRSTTINM